MRILNVTDQHGSARLAQVDDFLRKSLHYGQPLPIVCDELQMVINMLNEIHHTSVPSLAKRHFVSGLVSGVTRLRKLKEKYTRVTAASAAIPHL